MKCGLKTVGAPAPMWNGRTGEMCAARSRKRKCEMKKKNLHQFVNSNDGIGGVADDVAAIADGAANDPIT